jgi:hypothetical protein
VASLGYLGLVGGPALIGGFASLAGLQAALCLPPVLALCAVFFVGIVVPAQPAQDPPGGSSARPPALPSSRPSTSVRMVGADQPALANTTSSGPAGGRRRPGFPYGGTHG